MRYAVPSMTLFAAFAASAAGAQVEPRPTPDNEIFVWGGAADLEPGLGTKLVGATYGRYFGNWLALEGGIEAYRNGFSGSWLRLNALFGTDVTEKLSPYFLAGTSSFFPELGGGLKLHLSRSFGARFDFTFTLDDDEGWYSNLRGGILLAF